MRGLVKFVPVEYEYRQKFEHIFQFFSNGLLLIDEEGIVLEMNTQMEEILQINKNEVIGYHAVKIMDLFVNSYESNKEFIAKALRFGEAELCTEILTFLGDLKYIYIKVSKQEDSNIYLVEIHDESEKIQMKKRLNHTESLSTIGQLAASIAHEIRNPMTSLKGFTQLLHQTTNEDGKRYLAVINEEIKRMEEILTEFLEVSKPTNNKFNSFDIKELILEVANFMAPQALMKNIELIISLTPESKFKFLGDKNLMKQVFMNSIKNAIEAMPKGGNIFITISNIGMKDVCIEIKDQGQGIEADKIDKIFDPFFTTKSEGTGLGLSHSIQVIKSHGGTIEVVSEVEVGTSFKFILPLQKEI
ncbi:ATP-binding protein [Psychrobacillus sp. NEAU-3TGS]|uniref:ATP-binding protein n=1 Tax=Psychrobacillus sp. NEAU-3TGS TaxID=2995412 RepID=UPI002496E652|nr:ATP-binding protein [Psychrobacillus sp. NEAU-3TGS]MDI2589621.1 ATP-binding protein [Psychrobacillus sp. NEAU-3TGS]